MGHKSCTVGEELLRLAPALSPALGDPVGKQVGLQEPWDRMGRSESPMAPGPSTQSRRSQILSPRYLCNFS